MELFRELTENEKIDFRAWACRNYAPLSPISDLWHPEIKNRCEMINLVANSINDKISDSGQMPLTPKELKDWGLTGLETPEKISEMAGDFISDLDSDLAEYKNNYYGE